MAAATTKQLSKKLSSIAESWIKDPFRPNLQLQTFLKSLSAHPRLTPQAVDAACALRDNQMQKKVSHNSRPNLGGGFFRFLIHLFFSTPCQREYYGPPLLRFIMNDSLKGLKRAHWVYADPGGKYFSGFGKSIRRTR